MEQGFGACCTRTLMETLRNRSSDYRWPALQPEFVHSVVLRRSPYHSMMKDTFVLESNLPRVIVDKPTSGKACSKLLAHIEAREANSAKTPKPPAKPRDQHLNASQSPTKRKEKTLLNRACLVAWAAPSAHSEESTDRQARNLKPHIPSLNSNP